MVEIAGFWGRAAIDSTFFERHRASAHYGSRTDYTFDKLNVTLLIDIETHAVIDMHCTTRKMHDTQISTQVLLGDTGYEYSPDLR